MVDTEQSPSSATTEVKRTHIAEESESIEPELTQKITEYIEEGHGNVVTLGSPDSLAEDNTRYN